MKTETQIRDLAEKEYPIESKYVESFISKSNIGRQKAFIKGYTACQNQVQEDYTLLQEILYNNDIKSFVDWFKNSDCQNEESIEEALLQFIVKEKL